MSIEYHKIVLIGESGVGKTSIISQFINEKFDSNVLSTFGEQFARKEMQITEDKKLTIDLWDTVGQEKHRSITKIFYKDAEAVIFVYDITDRRSFEEIKKYWHLAVLENGASNVIFALVGNKNDLYEKRTVNDEEAIKYADDINAIFVTTSAKNASGINELFKHIGKKIINPDYDYKKDCGDNKKIEPKPKGDDIPIRQTIHLSQEDITKDLKVKKKKCCSK